MPCVVRPVRTIVISSTPSGSRRFPEIEIFFYRFSLQQAKFKFHIAPMHVLDHSKINFVAY